MHSTYMQALCNCMYLVHNPRLDHTCFACHVYMTRRDRDMTSRSPICLMRRNRS